MPKEISLESARIALALFAAVLGMTMLLAGDPYGVPALTASMVYAHGWQRS
jgi:hypothetical protein